MKMLQQALDLQMEIKQSNNAEGRKRALIGTNAFSEAQILKNYLIL
jgi:hypothetical protein